MCFEIIISSYIRALQPVNMIWICIPIWLVHTCESGVMRWLWWIYSMITLSITLLFWFAHNTMPHDGPNTKFFIGTDGMGNVFIRNGKTSECQMKLRPSSFSVSLSILLSLFVTSSPLVVKGKVFQRRNRVSLASATVDAVDADRQIFRMVTPIMWTSLNRNQCW